MDYIADERRNKLKLAAKKACELGWYDVTTCEAFPKKINQVSWRQIVHIN